MKKLIAVALLFCISSVLVQAQNKKKKALAGYTEKDYEIICQGVGSQGTKLVKVYSYAKKPERATLLAKKNAVRAIIFRGAQNNSNGCMGIKPLSDSPTKEMERADFFDAFFQDGGKYLSYVSVSSQGGNAMEVIKVDKRTYKVGVTMSVMYDRLRKDLEDAGIIKSLTSGF